MLPPIDNNFLPSRVKTLRRSRIAVSSVFFANGMIVGCWALLVPFIIANLKIDESDMGLIILSGGLAAIAALTLSPSLINFLGARTVIAIAAIVLAPSLFLTLQTASIGAAIAILLFLMAALATQDVAMNANAAELEQQAGRAIMSSFHGFWSAGAMVAALSGGFVIARFGAEFLAASTGIAALAAAIGGFNWLEKKADTDPKSITKIAFLPRSLIPWLFGLIAFTGFVSEGAVIDWSAHYFRTELASSIEMSGFAFGGFSFSMMLARFIGDRLREKFTDRALFVYSILIAALGLACVIGAPNPILASLGFFLAGFGNANLVPIAFSAAAKIKGLPKGLGIATATFCGYAGLLFAPASLGYLGEAFGFRFVFGAMAALLLAMLFIAPTVGRETASKR